jgi:hypothetical protein
MSNTNKRVSKSGQAVIYGVDANGDPVYIKAIEQNRALVTLDPTLAATFQGKEFFYSEAFLLAETTDSRDYVFVTPNTTEWAHFTFHASGSAITEISLWEDTELTTTSDYTLLTTYNNNRNSTDTADCLLYQTPLNATATDSGTRLIHEKSGSATQQSKDSMDAGYADELFLKQNSYYRISYGTETTGNLCNLKVQWHEHTNET